MEGYLAGAISRWNTGAAGAHLCVLRDGTVVRTVRLEDIAWHAGTDNNPNSGVYGRDGFWRSHNVNPFSVGIENEGFAASGITEAQVQANIRIARYLTSVYHVPAVHVQDQIAGHHTHAEISSNRTDPGGSYPLARIVAACQT
jgi:N-acetyl-anhydromuramyl-L-alanine amidase AmpD